MFHGIFSRFEVQGLNDLTEMLYCYKYCYKNLLVLNLWQIQIIIKVNIDMYCLRFWIDFRDD